MSAIDSGRSGLGRGLTRRSLALMNWTVLWRSIFDSTCSGTSLLFTAFLLALAVEKEDMGYFPAAVSFACLLQMICLAILNQLKNRKRYIITLGVVEAVAMMVLVSAAPFLPGPWRVGVVAVGLLMAAACVHLTRPLTDEWLASLIPPGLRGRYLSRRLRFMNLGFLAGVGIVGLVDLRFGAEPIWDFWAFLDSIARHWVLGVLLLAGTVCGVASVITLSRAHMADVSLVSMVRFRDLPQMWRARRYLRLVLAVVLINVPFCLPLGYFHAFNLDVVGMPLWLVCVMWIGYLTVKSLWMRPASRLVDRYGPRQALLIFLPMYMGLFFAMAAAGPGRPWLVFVAWGASLVVDAVWMVATQVALYGSVPKEGARPAYFAVFNIFMLAPIGLGGLVAVPVMHALKDVTLEIGPLTLSQFQILFVSSGVLMIPACLGPLLMDRDRMRAGQNCE